VGGSTVCYLVCCIVEVVVEVVVDDDAIVRAAARGVHVSITTPEVFR
jgi:hypothetical protein